MSYYFLRAEDWSAGGREAHHPNLGSGTPLGAVKAAIWIAIAIGIAVLISGLN